MSKPEHYSNEWFFDYGQSEHKIVMHRTKEQVVSVQTAHQAVKIVDTCGLGRILVLDNQLHVMHQ